MKKKTDQKNSIAIIGMACRAPGSSTIDTFWQNIKLGKDSISRFNAKDADDALERTTNDFYVPAKGMITDIDRFDSELFGFNKREADIMDPQHRVFLETCF